VDATEVHRDLPKAGEHMELREAGSPVEKGGARPRDLLRPGTNVEVHGLRRGGPLQVDGQGAEHTGRRAGASEGEAWYELRSCQSQPHAQDRHAPFGQGDSVLQRALVEGVGRELGQDRVHAVLDLQANRPHTQHDLHTAHAGTSMFITVNRDSICYHPYFVLFLRVHGS
jgi:hypothetical protein